MNTSNEQHDFKAGEFERVTAQLDAHAAGLSEASLTRLHAARMAALSAAMLPEPRRPLLGW